MKKIFAILMGLFTSFVCAKPLDETQFTNEFLARARLLVTDLEFNIIQPLQIKAKNINGYELTVFLGNAFAIYKSDPSRLQVVMDGQIETIKSKIITSDKQVNNSIFAVIKPADYIETVKRQLAQANIESKDIPFVFDKINDDLYVVYVYDSESGMQMIHPDNLAEHNINQSSLRGMAVKNLYDYVDKTNLSIQQVSNTGAAKIYKINLDENYEASLFLLDELWNKNNFDVAGDLVVFIPARNIVLVTGSEDAEGLHIAEYLAESGFKELGYAISPYGYQYNAGAWKRYQP